MFCKNCGSQLDDDCLWCPHCGTQVGQRPTPHPYYQEPKEAQDSNAIGLVGFILSFVVAIAGLICSIIGLKNASNCGGKNRGFALAGIIISSVELAIEVLAIIVLIFLIALYPEAFENGYHWAMYY